MFINRLNGKLEAPESRARGPDLWFVRATSGCFFVTRETAQAIANKVRSVWPRPWVRFRDLSGSEIHLRRRDIINVIEASAAQRAWDRHLQRMLEAESRDDTPDWV